MRIEVGDIVKPTQEMLNNYHHMKDKNYLVIKTAPYENGPGYVIVVNAHIPGSSKGTFDPLWFTLVTKGNKATVEVLFKKSEKGKEGQAI